MPKRVLWGRNTSVNVQKVVWTLEELGLDYERKDVGGNFRRPRHARIQGAMNPNQPDSRACRTAI